MKKKIKDVTFEEFDEWCNGLLVTVNGLCFWL